jgi:RNA polymerase sigma factor (sigma-70 family)
MKRLASLERSRSSDSDAALVQRVANGDLNALALLYDAYVPDLMPFAVRLSGSGDAEDLVQTVFLRVVRIAHTFDRNAASARPWLFAILVRVARERSRSLRRWAATLLRVGEHNSAEAIPLPEAAWDMTRALRQLSVSKRSVLLLAELEGFSCPEIARMLGIPVGTVWTRLHHARRELRAFLEGASP